jgi:hypothetical protein
MNNIQLKRFAFLVSIIGLLLLSCSKADRQVPKELNKTAVYEIVPKTGDVRDKVYRNFQILFYPMESTSVPEIVLYCDEGISYSPSGESIVSFPRFPPLYGYNLEFRLDQKTQLPGVLIIGPLFGDGENVGDTITLEWDNKKNTFLKSFQKIP